MYVYYNSARLHLLLFCSCSTCKRAVKSVRVASHVTRGKGDLASFFFIYQVGEGMQVEGFRARFLLEKRRM